MQHISEEIHIRRQGGIVESNQKRGILCWKNIKQFMKAGWARS